MANNQFGLKFTSPGTNAYGVSVDFIVPTGMVNIADTSAGLWATASNLLGLRSDGSWVECSITYSETGGPKPKGWYFWRGYSGNTVGTYQTMGYDPTGHSVTMKLQYTNATGIFQATLIDHSNSTTFGPYSIAGAFGISLASSWEFFETRDNNTCSNYSSFGSGVTYNNVTYFDINGNQISFTSTAFDVINNSPPTCIGCISENTSSRTVSYHGC